MLPNTQHLLLISPIRVLYRAHIPSACCCDLTAGALRAVPCTAVCCGAESCGDDSFHIW